MKGLLFFDIYPSILRCLARVEGNRLKMMNKKMWVSYDQKVCIIHAFGLSLKKEYQPPGTFAYYGYRKHCEFLLTLHIEDITERLLRCSLRGGHLNIFKNFYKSYERQSFLLYIEVAIIYGNLNIVCYLIHLANGLSLYDKNSLLKIAKEFGPQDIYDHLNSINLLGI